MRTALLAACVALMSGCAGHKPAHDAYYARYVGVTSEVMAIELGAPSTYNKTGRFEFYTYKLHDWCTVHFTLEGDEILGVTSTGGGCRRMPVKRR